MGGGGYLGIRGYRGLAVVDVATIGESDSLLEHGPHMVGYGEVGFELRYESSSLKLYKELSSSNFQSCQ